MNRPVLGALAVGVVCLAMHSCSCAKPQNAVSVHSLDIVQATKDADVIVVGGPPQETHLMDIRGRVGPGIYGYSIKPILFLKGTPSSRKPRTRISIANPSYRPSRARGRLILPTPRSRTDSFIYFLRERRASYDSFPGHAPIVLQSWFVPATTQNVSLVKKSLPRPGKWGRQSDGLVLGVRTLKQVYAVGEPVAIELYVKNASAKHILFPQQRLAASDCYPFLEFSGGNGIKVMGSGASYSNGRGIILGFLSKPVGESQADVMPPVDLAPGEIHMERINLDSWQWTSTDGRTPLRSGISLKMHAFLHVPDLRSDLQYRDYREKHLWSGRAETPYFDLVFKAAAK